MTTNDSPDPRTVVLWEGVITNDLRRIKHATTTWRDTKLPLMIRDPHAANEYIETQIHGYMTDLRREENGSITAVCVPPIPEGHHLGADLAGGEYDVDEESGVITVKNGRLIGAMIHPASKPSVWPTPEENQ